MELVIDIGNTRVKAAVFINNGIHKVFNVKEADAALVERVAPFKITSVIVSSVRPITQELRDLWGTVAPLLVLDHTTPLPIHNAYKTPETLGKDRIAAVIGGRFLYPEGPVLSIDAGTCITYDLITSEDVYLGGNISPGIHLRYRAMDEFTSALPLVSKLDVEALYGQSTEESMATGVITGMSAEIDGMITRYESAFPGLKTVICGGDARYFVNNVKKEIFANQNLVLLGLHKILLFNEKNLT
ncbi:MAG: type III pantothenate kinase [Bacteroidia bacterium]|jgi:type III pantothenate kinase